MAVDKHDANTQRSEDGGVFAADDPGANDAQRTWHALDVEQVSLS